MRKFSSVTYRAKIVWRIRVLSGVLFCMLVYMIVIGELGRDSRMQTGIAEIVSQIIYFGGLIYVISRIVQNRKLLKNNMKLKEQQLMDEDERYQYLHDKSGGSVLDILMIVLLFVTCTAAFFNMPAFYTALAILGTAVFLKAGTYFIYSH